MSRGRRRQHELQLPERLLDFLRDEPQQVDTKNAERRFTASGVREVVIRLGDAERVTAIAVTGPGLDIYVDVLWDASDSPVALALEELVGFTEKFALLRRLHIAHTDMELVAMAARELAPYRHKIGGPEAPAQGPLTLIGEVLEAGIAVVYARNFTGDAALGKNWRPEDQTDRELHRRLMDLRNKLHAHADWTADRTLVNTTAMLGMEGPPVIAETRSQLSGDELRDIAALCDRQAARFYEETWHLKRDLGFPVAGSGGDELDTSGEAI